MCPRRVPTQVSIALLLNEISERKKKTQNVKRYSPKFAPKFAPKFPGRWKRPPPPKSTRVFPQRFQISNRIPNQISPKKFTTHLCMFSVVLFLDQLRRARYHHYFRSACDCWTSQADPGSLMVTGVTQPLPLVGSFWVSHHGAFFCRKITAISRLLPLEFWCSEGHFAQFDPILTLF